MARTKIATIKSDADSMSLTFNFSNGKTVTVSPMDFPENSQKFLLLYGTKQKLADGYASAEGNAESAFSGVQEMIDALAKGETGRTREPGSGPASAQIDLAIVDVAQAKGKTMTIEEAREWRKNLPEGKASALRSDPRIAAAIAKRAQDRANKEVSELDNL
jgi:hypothetical protein